MTYTGNIQKMGALADEQGRVHYTLQMGGDQLDMNALLGKELEITFLGEIYCKSCGKRTGKSYAQGFCFQCMQTAPEAEECVLRPALCKAHLGVARDMDYARQHCLQSHYVYLANTGELKVGVTRASQIPTRWIDQGAVAAVPLCITPNRHIAGLIEQQLSAHISDKTSWKKMVSNNINADIDLTEERSRAVDLLTAVMRRFVCSDVSLRRFIYPVAAYPTAPVNHNLDKEARLCGKLLGIKGQYLLFEGERVLNLRRFSGYRLSISG